MAQIVLDLDERTEAALRAQAKAAGKSISQFVSDVVAPAAGDAWPQWWLDLPAEPDFPAAEDIRAGDLPDRGPPYL